MKLTARTSPQTFSAAFSLVEVILAVGIAAITVVTLLGLLPASLSSIQHSNSDGAEARVLQAIMADYQQRDWPSILRQQEAATAELLYFDTNAFRVEATDRDAFLIAQVSILPAPLLPGSTVANPRLRTLRLRTSREVMAGAAAFEEKRVFRQTQAVLPQMDKSP
jgi:uncharacterized protein (TIGR02598 family)